MAHSPVLPVLVLSLASACGSTADDSGLDANPMGGTGGVSAAGGGTSAGGLKTSGGQPGTGGSVGAPASGGTGVGTATGGSATSGGSSAAGGSATNGGSAVAGGSPATGGNTANGGSAAGGSAAGGTVANGGSAAGGSAAGGSAAGGSAASGGSPANVDPGALATDTPIGFASLNGGTVGGKGGEVVTARSYDELKSYAGRSQPTIIMVEGTISNGGGGGIINVASKKSIIGVGSSAFLDRVSIGIRGSSNIIIRNLKITLVGLTKPTELNDGDNISISGSSKNIWIDHCELYSEDPAKQKNHDFYDGLIDIKNSSGYITVSWNYAHDHHKGFLVGSSKSDLYGERKITYHHNHFARVRKRTPTYRGAVGHVFNNYVTAADQATFAMTGTCLRVERNYYENQVVKKYSIFTNSEEPGKAEEIDNFIDGGNNRAFPPSCKADIPYSYESVLIKNAMDVKAIVMQGAGVGKL